MDLFGVGTLLADCVPPENLSIFHPVSPGGRSIVSLSILVLAITGGILLVVGTVLMYCVFRFRTKTFDGHEPPQVYGSVPIEVAWTAAPAMIVFILVLVTTRTLWEVEIPVPEPVVGDNTLFVTVVGRQWWWEYQYEYYNGQKLGFTTANELHMPVSEASQQRRVYLTLKSADVCHSFWVPRLAGKTDLIPGRVNSMWLQTEQPGLYLGQCAEYCGTQHAHMLLRVNVESPAEFERWLQQEASVALHVDEATITRGREVFLGLSCINCHAVRGTGAKGTYGPDLTHIMSRATLASGQIPNNRENLRSWIADPQKIKPGCLMPAFGLSDKQLDEVVSYLESLR
ncbi:cytochrome c oxidase subunit II [Anatilimnocola aggregata]|nr:cytochrome c oxidase subunit II [Anatilimnocola aggregata]